MRPLAFMEGTMTDLVERTRALILRLKLEDRTFLQERLDRYLTSLGKAEAGGPEAAGWKVTADSRAENLGRYVEEMGGRRKK